jgi:ADP-heptose:LPS heptosyltransferase
MDYVIEIQGGIGKHIMATSFIKWLNEKYPDSKIKVISAYPEIFEYNPRVYRNLKMGQAYLFEDYIHGCDLRKGEPYSLVEYYRDENKMHCMKLFPKAYGFEYNENPQSEVYLTKGEEMDGQLYNSQNQNLITLQATGGLPPGIAYSKEKIDMDQRDMPFEFACKIVSLLNQKGYKVLQIRGQGERPIPDTLQLNIPFRNLLPIVKYAKGHVGIDSSMMHGAAIFKKPQLIFWGSTHKDNLGYTENVTNISNKYGMHCRPYLQVDDLAGCFPFRDKNQGKEFDYSAEELAKIIDNFVTNLKK